MLLYKFSVTVPKIDNKGTSLDYEIEQIKDTFLAVVGRYTTVEQVSGWSHSLGATMIEDSVEIFTYVPHTQLATLFWFTPYWCDLTRQRYLLTATTPYDVGLAEANPAQAGVRVA